MALLKLLCFRLSRITVIMAAIMTATLSSVTFTFAQPSGKPAPGSALGVADNPADKTILEIELLMPAVSSDPLIPQKWRKVFEEVGEGVRIRQPLPDDRVTIHELTRGPFRLVRLTGEITREGDITFPDKTFRLNDSELLKEYLGELKVYGAQGAPTGKPMWGLSKTQFESLFNLLTPPVPTEQQGKKYSELLKTFPLPESLPLAFHSSAEPIRKMFEDDIFNDEIQGLSIGTGLAFVLSQQGLGFRPLRTPAGDIQLLVHPLVDAPDAWPVGWPVDETLTRDQIVPGLFKMVETGVNESPLTAVLHEIEVLSGTRILIDRFAAAAKKLIPEEIIVSYPRRKTAWALIVSSVVVNAKMTMNYRQDEAARGFIFVAPFEHYQPEDSLENAVPQSPLPPNTGRLPSR